MFFSKEYKSEKICFFFLFFFFFCERVEVRDDWLV